MGATATEISYLGFDFRIPYDVHPKDFISIDADGTFKLHQRDVKFTEETALANLPVPFRTGLTFEQAIWSSEYWVSSQIIPVSNSRVLPSEVDIDLLTRFGDVKCGGLIFKLEPQYYRHHLVREGLLFGLNGSKFKFYSPELGRELSWLCGEHFKIDRWYQSLIAIGALKAQQLAENPDAEQVEEPENIVNLTMDSILDKTGDGPVFIQVCQQDYSGMLSVFSDLEISVSIAGARYDKIFDAKKYQILTAAVEAIRSMVTSN